MERAAPHCDIARGKLREKGLVEGDRYCRGFRDAARRDKNRPRGTSLAGIETIQRENLCHWTAQRTAPFGPAAFRYHSGF